VQSANGKFTLIDGCPDGSTLAAGAALSDAKATCKGCPKGCADGPTEPEACGMRVLNTPKSVAPAAQATPAATPPLPKAAPAKKGRKKAEPAQEAPPPAKLEAPPAKLEAPLVSLPPMPSTEPAPAKSELPCIVPPLPGLDAAPPAMPSAPPMPVMPSAMPVLPPPPEPAPVETTELPAEETTELPCVAPPMPTEAPPMPVEAPPMPMPTEAPPMMQLEVPPIPAVASPVETPPPPPPPLPPAKQEPVQGLASTLPDAAEVLTALLMGSTGTEEQVDIEAALDTVEGLEGGPSVGGISWHTLEPAMQCWRKAYYKHVCGYVKKVKSRHFGFGTLYHACWELWYRYGGRRPYDEPCDAVRRAGAPKLAGEVQRLVYMELTRYAEEEAKTWDVRAVEQNAIFWMEPEKIDGKTVYVPLTCRHDMILAKHEEGSPCAPPGPVPHGVYILDHKTAGALTYDVTKGYGMDGQFRMNALVFNRSGEVEVFGPLNGILVAVGIKHAKPDPKKSFFRIEAPVEDSALAEFYKDEIRPYALELYRRLASKRYREDRSLWAKCTASCVGRYGCCEFFDVCDVGGEAMLEASFKVDPKRILDVERFAPPPAEVKRAMKEDVASTEASRAETQQQQGTIKSRSAERKAFGEFVLKAFASAVQQFEAFMPKAYLVPGHTEKTVLTQLEDNLRRAWPVDTEFKLMIEAVNDDGEVVGREVTMTIMIKGITWSVMGSHGRLTYRNAAKEICRDWWDITRLRSAITSDSTVVEE